MARGVTLDRRKRYEVAHGNGAPVASTKGNIYIDDNTEAFWTRAVGGAWTMNSAESWWTRTGTTLSPLNSGDSFSIAPTSTAFDSVKINTAGGIDIDTGAVGAFDLDANGIFLTATGIFGIDSSLASSAAVSISATNIAGGIYTSAGTGGMSFTTTGNIDIDAARVDMDSSLDTNITAVGAAIIDGTGYSRISYNGNQHGVNLTNLGIDVYTQGTGPIVIRSAETLSVNAVTGSIFSNAAIADVGYPEGEAFIKIPDQASSVNPLHLYNTMTDIMIETGAGSCDNDIILNSADNINCDAIGGIWLDAGSDITLAVADNTNSDILFTAHGGTTIALNTVADPSLVGFTKTSIIGAFNELKAAGGGGLTTFTTVAAAESATGSDNDLCYVVETETIYRYESAGSAFTDDNVYFLSTGDGGNTRWIGVAGGYESLYQRVDTGAWELPQLSTTGTQHDYWARGADTAKGAWTGSPVKIRFFGALSNTNTLGSVTNLIDGSVTGTINSGAVHFSGGLRHSADAGGYEVSLSSNGGTLTVTATGWAGAAILGGYVLFN